MRKTIVWVAIVAILLICIHYLFLSRKAPKETYPDDTFLDTLKEKRAVVIVAHDDDAIGIAGTVSQLCTSGWNVKELCFYNTDTDAAKIARIQQRQEDVSTVKQIEGLADFVYFNIPFRKVTNLSGPEYMPLTKEEFDKQYDTDTLRYYIRRFIDDNKPAVIFFTFSLRFHIRSFTYNSYARRFTLVRGVKNAKKLQENFRIGCFSSVCFIK